MRSVKGWLEAANEIYPCKYGKHCFILERGYLVLALNIDENTIQVIFDGDPALDWDAYEYLTEIKPAVHEMSDFHRPRGNFYCKSANELK